MDERNQITEGVIWKQLLIFFFPIMIGTFFQQIYNTADSIVVGRFVGKEALAAVGGSVNQIVNLVVEVFVGLTSGASVIAAQFYGAKDRKNLNKTLHTSYAFGITTGCIVGVLGFFLTDTVLTLMKTPQELMADSRIYLHIYFCGMVFNIIYNMGASILRAVGDSKRPLYVLMVTCGLNIVLDIILVVVCRLGVMGVALATVSCQGISSALVTVLLMKENPLFQLKLREIRFYGVSLKSVLRIGIPAALEATMYTIANLIIQVFVNELGTDTVAAWGTFACGLLDGRECLCNFYNNLCRSELWGRKGEENAKKRGDLSWNGLCGRFPCKRSPVCTGCSALQTVYDRCKGRADRC